jgi:rare lipoprotein A
MFAMSLRNLSLLCLASVLLSACSSPSLRPTVDPDVATTPAPPDRYQLKQDVAPEGKFDASLVPDLIPQWEPLSYRGNKSPYTVLGSEYHIMNSAEGYSEVGTASWYGLKFHGEQTSNGETYNMYSLSAAHKTLPLPTWLRVTNLENNKSIIVRVNDRGPFHGDRIIDLSYAAAHKLDYANKGTARVKLEAISFDQPVLAQTSRDDQIKPFVQVAAYSNEQNALQVKQRLQNLLPQADVFVAASPDSERALYRVRIGPFDSQQAANQAQQLVAQANIGQPMVIVRALSGKHH